MKRLIIYVHGKGGNAEEAEHYKPLFAGDTVVGFDYESQTPWDAKEEFSAFFDSACVGYDSVILIANSIGAFFSMHSLAEKRIERALFISPVVDMVNLIGNMMRWANVTESELCTRGEIPTDFGETLSWEYLCYVKNNPIEWKIPTHILYGEKDNLTSEKTMRSFAARINAPLTVMKNGEHWFHTPEQMSFLDNWVTDNTTIL